MACVLVDPGVESRRDRLLRAGRFLTELREKRGLTQRVLAAQIERSPQVLSTYERGVVQVPEVLAGALAEALGVGIAEMRAGLGMYVSESDVRDEQEVLRLPRGVKLSDLDPADRAALETIVDAFIESVRREDR